MVGTESGRPPALAQSGKPGPHSGPGTSSDLLPGTGAPCHTGTSSTSHKGHAVTWAVLITFLRTLLPCQQKAASPPPYESKKCKEGFFQAVINSGQGSAKLLLYAEHCAI